MTSWIGQTLNDRFKVEQALGRGGMASVYLAADLRLDGRKVVVKHPLREADPLGTGLSDDELRRRFQGEVARLIRLDDIPNVVQILDQGVHEGTPFYVMRHMAGGSLADLLARVPQAPGEALGWLEPIAEALDRLHERGVLHRDVKPDNLLFDQPPTGPKAAQARAHLSDFGIVKELSAEWATTGKQNTGIGTPGYMAPEQLLEDYEPDGRADQYALAATLYHALTGGKPRYGPTTGTTGGRKALTPVHALAPHVPERVSAQIARALSREPEGRFPTCTAFARAVEDALNASDAGARVGGDVPTARPNRPSAPEAPMEPRANARWRRTLLAAVVLALVAGGYHLLQKKPTEPPVAKPPEATGLAAGPSPSPASVEPWDAPLARAEAARSRDDGQAAELALEEAKRAGVPYAKVADLSAYVAASKQDPVLAVTSPVEHSTLEAGDDGTWMVPVRGTLQTGRARDEVFVNGAAVRTGAGSFTTTLTLRSAGAVVVTVEVRHGETVRVERTLSLTLRPPPSPPPPPAEPARVAPPKPTPPTTANSDAAPIWVQGRARELWGRYANFLQADPDAVKIPPLDAPGVDPSGRIRGWLGPALSGLNPITTQDGSLSRQIMLRCLESMADLHVLNPSKYAPALAVRAEHDPEFKEWVLWLRPGVRWHTPQVDLDKYPHLKGVHEVTAHDVKFTLDLILNPDVEAGDRRSYYAECAGIEVVDDHCFIIRWKKKQFNALRLTLRELLPLPQFLFAFDGSGQRYAPERVGAAFNDHWFYREDHFIGCGPYVLVEYDKSSHCLLRRFEDYYAPERLPPVRECWFDIFPDRNLAVSKLRAGEEDYGNLLPQMWDEWRKDPNSPLAKGQMEENWLYTSQYGFIAWKQTHPIFRDLKVRTAMTMACDRPRILSTLRLGKGKVITGPHHLASANYPTDLEPLPFNLEQARALLAEAGWKDADGNGVLEKEVDGQTKEFRFTAMIPQNIEWKAVFEIFKEDLSKIGVIMSLDQLHWQQFSERLDARTFECTALYWDTSGWDDDLYQIWHSSQIKEVPSSNFIEFQDAEVDRLIEQARETFDVTARIAIQQRAHRRIAELQPYTFVDTIQLPLLTWKDRIGNVKAGLVYKSKPFARTFCWTALAR